MLMSAPPPAYSAPSALNQQNVPTFGAPGIQNQISSRKTTGAFPKGFAALSANPLIQQNPQLAMLVKLLAGGMQ